MPRSHAELQRRAKALGFQPGRPAPPVRQVIEETAEHAPGRIEGEAAPALRPKPADSPWRSKWYVSARTSADGNAYRPGEPIPEAEATRQGLLVEEGPRPVQVRQICQRCEGRRTYSRRRPKSHPEGHDCVFCGPCPRCEGTGYEPKEGDDAGEVEG